MIEISCFYNRIGFCKTGNLGCLVMSDLNLLSAVTISSSFLPIVSFVSNAVDKGFKGVSKSEEFSFHCAGFFGCLFFVGGLGFFLNFHSF